MTSLLIAMFVAGTMPYALTAAAKLGAFRGRDNARTREWQQELTGWRKRAHWAHLNAFEAFPLFASAILALLVVAPAHPSAPVWAWAYVALRAGYSACYLGNWPRLRSAAWFLALACVTVLYYLAIRAV